MSAPGFAAGILAKASDEDLRVGLDCALSDLVLAERYEYKAHLRPAIRAHIDRLRAEIARRTPMNCQQEPAYPGAETVVFSLRNPDITCHHPTPRCTTQEPHRISECGEFGSSSPSETTTEVGND